ncbi:MAG: TPM domain-containing protein [Candidatus Binatus sp.]|uniref:TPM domain-containing protein n=1 Tax=Candidatus Binatus sp. TaxID=2811406 RepID=UPI002722C55C|nr:TPM domain-containing protein [Candidatus Binatus sp.]MDO8432030.1 TPM domain-containing protein [Candidatus Binatus sp.]
MLVLLMLFAAPSFAAEPKFPELTGRVVDDAGILDPSTTSQLTEMLAHHEQTTGQQVVVVTLPTLQGYPIEDFGYQLGRHWGIGQKGKNTGAMLIVAPAEHKVRIEVGYGLEGTLTDAISRTIIEQDVVPNFKRGDFNAGVLAATASIVKVLGGDASIGSEATSPRVSNDNNLNSMIPILAVILMILLMIRSRLGNRNSVVRRMGRSYGNDPWRGGGGGFSGGSGGGGFSGGGGSFGGGGASGSW